MLRTADKRLFVSRYLSDVLPAFDLTPLAAYISEVLTDSPRAFWPLQESSGLPQDISGNGLHMTTSNGGGKTYGVVGPFSGAVGITMPGAQNFQRTHVSTVQNNFTLETWLKYGSHGGDDRLFYNGTGGSSGWGIDFRASTGKIRGLYGGVAFLSDSVASITGGAWMHIVMVRDSGTLKYYVNGSVDTANAGTSTPNAPSGVTQIGSDAQVQATWSLVALYETALSAARISAHYEAAT